MLRPPSGKRSRLWKKNNIQNPHQLSFVPINFQTQDIKETLFSAGYDPSLKTLFIWESVTYYLSEEVVKQTLYFIQKNSGPKSRVTFDYFYKSFIEGNYDFYGAKELSQSVSKTGEPYQFGTNKGQIDSFLSENGFDILSNFTPDELEKKYLFAKNENAIKKVYGFAGHVYAQVKT